MKSALVFNCSRRVAVFTSCCLWAAVANAATTMKTYDVSGSTIDKLVTSLNANGPSGGWAETKNQWSNKYKWNTVGGEIKYTSATSILTSIITMPNWPAYGSASKCMQKSWDKMYASLKNHENQHVKLAAGVDVEIKEAILALPPQPSSSTKPELEAVANAAAKLVTEKNQEKQDKFDADTDHGKNDPNDPVILAACP